MKKFILMGFSAMMVVVLVLTFSPVKGDVQPLYAQYLSTSDYSYHFTVGEIIEKEEAVEGYIPDGTGDAIIQTALSQVGQSGGKPYWTWWGLSYRDEWCAMFASWCADQNGYLESETFPRFASCRVGIKWLKDKNLWYYATDDYTPEAGDLIFFDWELDSEVNHVGMVIRTDAERVYTVEGNSGNQVRTKDYELDNPVITGYGSPEYPAA